MPRNYPRSERVERVARQVLGEALHDLKDPRVGFATITAVKMTPDLRKASVYVSVLGTDDERRKTMRAIRHAAPHLRSVLGKQVRMRYLPVLEIHEDLTAIQGEKIESLLRQAQIPEATGALEEPE